MAEKKRPDVSILRLIFPPQGKQGKCGSGARHNGKVNASWGLPMAAIIRVSEIAICPTDDKPCVAEEGFVYAKYVLVLKPLTSRDL